ncbi:MAG: topoisomerase DNA-binding C4 zinc finger domain-containing protein [Clostridia bacterium]|nr:topoisomerase DNA-binding C4 zinc finger domain-containing protein [Clostridia bacterium]
MLGETPGKMKNIYVPNYVIFDLETTGVSPAYDEVVEISAIKVINGVVTDEFSTLVNPDRSIPYSASEINGITDAMVKDAPRFEEALKDFIDFAGDLTLVGHNINSFDMKFIWRDTVRYFGQTIANDYADTLSIARAYLPGLGHYTLSDLARYYGVDPSGAHRALCDCRMDQVIYECLAKEMEQPSEAAKRVKKCPQCGSIMKLRNGKFGEFWGCSGYPACKYTLKK